MSLSSDLMFAILSLDSYNRGYGAGIADGGPNDTDGLGESGEIGNATLKTRAELNISDAEYARWQAAGFYAIAYDVPDIGTVISYRGTDFEPALPSVSRMSLR